jgi:hypothetical protein
MASIKILNSFKSRPVDSGGGKGITFSTGLRKFSVQADIQTGIKTDIQR